MKIVLDLKVVMDTNVFVSGVFFNGPPYQILKAWQSGEFELVASQEILDEYLRVGEVLAEERPGVDLRPIFNFVVENATIYKPVKLKEPVCEDPDDENFLPVLWQVKAGLLLVEISTC